MPLAFTRTYRSDSTRPGPFGIGTGHSFGIPLAADGPTGAQLVLPTNFRVRFPTLNSTHTATPVYWGARLVQGGVAPYHVTFKDGTRWRYQDNGLMLGMDDRHGNTITLSRDGSNRVIRITEPAGRALDLEYDGQGRILRLLGPLNQTVTYTYNAAGDLETVTDPRGGVTRYTYDTHNLKTIQTPQGAVRGVVDVTIDYYASTPTRAQRQTLPNGGTWQFSYATAGGAVTQTTVTDPRGFVTEYGIATGYVTRVTNVSLGQTTTFTREAGTNFITRIVDPLNRTTDLRYDANKNVDRITRYKDPPANTQPVVHNFTYDTAAGHFNLLTSYTDPLNHTWTYGLDATGKNLVSMTNPLAKTWNITRDTQGRPTHIWDPLLHDTTFSYDPATGLLASARDHLSNSTSYTYDLLGRRITTTDPRAYVTRYTYDRLNRLIATANPLGQAVRFEYDANSNLTKVIDPRNGQIVYTYNTMDWLQTRTDQIGRPETYTYDLAGNVATFTDRKGQSTTWAAHDARNRPTTVTYHDASTLTYTYDAGGRLWQLTDSLSGTITRTFDALDRLTAETTPQGTISYAPDDADRRTTMTVAGQPPVSYSWDTANRLQTIARDTLVAAYGYDDANRRTSLTLPNGVTIGYGYDTGNRLTSLTYSGLQGGPQSLTYTYDTAGNRVRIGGSWARTLLPAAVSGGTYDAANRQLTLGGKTMTYDLNGNLATLTEGGQTITYTLDVRDRLTALSGPGLPASFAYDAEGRRTSKTIAGFSATFLYDGADITKEVAGGGTVNYLRNLLIDETLARIDEAGTSSYVPDALGSPLALTDAASGVSTEYSYEPFGRATANGAASQNVFQFTGRENDGTGLYFYRARYYHPELARFLQEDPIEVAGGDTNFYEYVQNNPVNSVDPTGFQSSPPFARPIVSPRPGPPIYIPDRLWIPTREQWEWEIKPDIEKIPGLLDPRPLIQAIASGIEACLIFMSKAGRDKGENEYTRAAKYAAVGSSKTPCDFLAAWLEEARLRGDIDAVRKIQQAQKFLGCRHSGHGRRTR